MVTVTFSPSPSMAWYCSTLTSVTLSGLKFSSRVVNTRVPRYCARCFDEMMVTEMLYDSLDLRSRSSISGSSA